METATPGQYAVGEAPGAHQLRRRDQGKDWSERRRVCGPSPPPYMALMGPQASRSSARPHRPLALRGQEARRAAGVEIMLSPNFFKEFVVNFDGTGKSVAEVNKALLGHQIFGGKDVSAEFPELGQSALYCVTEYYDQADIEKLAAAVKEVTS
jgi:glycine dehydrogenase subunit 1